MAVKKETKKVKNTSQTVVAKTDDGTIQITFTIPFSEVKKAREAVANEYAKSVEVPGFRKGKAPVEKVLEKIPQNTLIERTLASVLPKLVGDVIDDKKLKLAMYPKFDLVKADENEDWQVRAVTCEMPEVKLGDYKKAIAGASRVNALWTPGKDNEKKELTREQKESVAVKALLESIDITVPKVLVEEEVNSRLSRLLEKIEKLGLNLDSYLASTGKNPQTLRDEYEVQAKEAIILDLALHKIADSEGIAVDEKTIEAALQASQADTQLAEELNNPERKRMVETILRKREALNKLVTFLQ